LKSLVKTTLLFLSLVIMLLAFTMALAFSIIQKVCCY
jgi:hypothetical protein